MFEFVTISNGVAVVQHQATGHVYRFRPTAAGAWSNLTLQRVDVCQWAGDAPELHKDAALCFAEATAVQCHGAEADPAAVSGSRIRRFFSVARTRRSARQDRMH